MLTCLSFFRLKSPWEMEGPPLWALETSPGSIPCYLPYLCSREMPSFIESSNPVTASEKHLPEADMDWWLIDRCSASWAMILKNRSSWSVEVRTISGKVIVVRRPCYIRGHIPSLGKVNLLDAHLQGCRWCWGDLTSWSSHFTARKQKSKITGQSCHETPGYFRGLVMPYSSFSLEDM